MANTSYLRKDVEPYLLRWTARQIGVHLAEKKIIVGRNSEGRPIPYKFDGVSDDGTVGVCISASMAYKTGQMRKFFLEATLVNRVRKFKRRIMVFIEEDIWEGFLNQCDGLVDLKNIQPLICTRLPAKMRRQIKRIYHEAAREAGARRPPGIKVPGKRR